MRIELFLILLFCFNSDLTGQNTSKNFDIQKENLTLNELDTPPVISGCNSKRNKNEIALCLNTKFKKRLDRKLKLSVFNSDNLTVGEHKIIINFKISKEGEIVNINVNHDNSSIVNEIKRALKTFKKMKPGIVKGKPVGVLYSFPLNVVIYE